MKSPLSNVYYWRKGDRSQNFGDFISEYLTSRLFFGYRPGVSSVHIIGSVVDDLFVPQPAEEAIQPVLFWGCGIREPGGLSSDRMNSAQVVTVRGPLSASALELGVLAPYGDPAFLLPALYKPRKLGWLTGKSICVPHFHDTRDDRTILAMSGCDFVVRPNIENNERALTDVIDAIFSADFVLGSAMHACIVAAAYRRPFAFWGTGIVDVPFKWKDLSASLNIPCEFATNITDAVNYYKDVITPAIRLPNLIPSLLRSPLLVRASGLIEVLRWYWEEERDLAVSVDFLDDSRALNFFAEEQESMFNAILGELLDAKRSAALLAVAEKERDDALRKLEMTRQIAADAAEAAARSAKAESDLSAALAEAVARGAKTAQDFEIYRHRSLPGRMFFRWNGKPVRGLRRVLFHSGGKPRGIFRSWVIGKNGLPKKALRQWMTSDEYLALPKAYHGLSGETAVGGESSGAGSVSVDTPAIASQASVHPVLAGVPIRADGKRVLMIDSVYPTPDRDSGSVDAVNFVRIFLQMGYGVYFAATAKFESAALDAVAKMARVQLEGLGAVVIDDTHVRDIDELIQLSRGLFEIFFLSRVHAGGLFLDAIRTNCQNAKILFNTVDLHFVRELREGYLEGNRLKINAALRTRERELYLIRLADSTIVVSNEEVALLEREVPGASVYEMPLIRDVPGRKADFSSRTNIGFIGGYQHLPNIDAVKYFLEFIWPLVKRELPAAQFLLMGADMPHELSQRKDPGLAIVGQVNDLRDAFEGLRLTVAPLRYGAGAKGKVVSSLSHGVPCIGTSIAAEGMTLDESGGVLVADNAEDFAKLVVRAYTDEALWRRLSDGGLRLMRERHDFDTGLARMKMIVQGLDRNDATAR